MPKTETAHELKYQARQLNRLKKVPIGVLIWTIDHIDTSLIGKGILYLGSDSCYSVQAGYTGSVFATDTVVLACPLQDLRFYRDDSVQFVLDPRFVQIDPRLNMSLEQLQIMLPGQESRSISHTQPVAWVADTGTVFVGLNLRTGGTNHAAGGLMEVEYNGGWEHDHPPSKPAYEITAEESFTDYTGGAPYPGVGEVSVWYGAGRTHVQHPIIIVDGFDPKDQRGPGEFYGRYLKFSTVINGLLQMFC